MIEIKKTVIVPHTPQKMFDLVSDFGHYDKYLPWCTKSELISQDNNVVVGAIYLEYFKVKTHFITKNINMPNETIDIELIEGPFQHLKGRWQFIPLGVAGCKISFTLHYKFANSILEKIIGPVFGMVSKNIVDCFIKEANKSIVK